MKPIIFNTEMVRAILDGRKTQTRRVLKSRTGYFNVNFSHNGKVDSIEEVDDNGFSEDVRIEPKYQIGDVLWVRETWQNNGNVFYYKADMCDENKECSPKKWKPSIHMPKKVGRLFLKVTNVRVERLQDITEDDAIAEGLEEVHIAPFVIRYKSYIKEGITDCPIASFETLWQSINGKNDGYTWDDNPWVWVYDFEITDKPINQ